MSRSWFNIFKIPCCFQMLGPIFNTVKDNSFCKTNIFRIILLNNRNYVNGFSQRKPVSKQLKVSGSCRWMSSI
jgi:hypothetical protein